MSLVTFARNRQQRAKWNGLGRLGTVVFMIAGLGWSAAWAADPPRSPVAPQDSLAHLQLAPGLRAELVAAEPQVTDPVAIRFDAQGRMWVVEMRDYPWGPKEGELPQCQLRVLTDEDGDGFFETSRIFADQLLFTTGVQPWKGGVIVTMAGQVAYFKDTTGDGRADLRQIWYQGFVEDNSQLRANHPRFGLDNHIYIANGLRGGVVQDARQPNSSKVNINNMDFRFHPESFHYEAVSGVGQFGLTFDDYGNRFVCSNRNPVKHIVLKNRYLRRSPKTAISAVFHDAAKAGEASRIFPIARSWTTSTLHAGQFTAACGVFCYRGSGLPEEFRGNVFTCDPTGSLVHREIMTPRGGTFTGRRGREGVEFLASRDEWFKPVNMELGPDGALYVVDMYRAVIEHPRWVPDELKERPDTRYGDNRGRIYRITSAKAPASTKPTNYSQLPNARLVGLLAHDNAWQRELGARLLMERTNKDQPTAHLLANQLEQLARQGKSPHARFHALWSLEGLEKLSIKTIALALHDPDAQVRRQAVMLAERRLGLSADLRKRVTALARDEDAGLRFQVALSLIPVKTDVEMGQLSHILMAGEEDIWTRRAVRLAAANRVTDLMTLTLEQPLPKNLVAHRDAIVELAQATGRGATVSQLQSILGQLVQLPAEPRYQAIQFGGLDMLLRTAAGRKLGLATILTHGERSVAVEDVAAVFDRAEKLAAVARAPVTDRNLAIALLSYPSRLSGTLVRLCQPAEEQAIRLAALQSLARRKELAPWPELLDRFAGESPVVRRALLDGALRSSPRIGLLLDRIEKGSIKAAEIDQTRIKRLLGTSQPALRARAAKLLADTVPADRKQVLADYQVVLKLKATPQAGEVIFRKQYATCHRIGKIGQNVAPDIADSRSKQPAQLLTHILQPNRVIDSNYISYSVVTNQGKVLTGILTTETSTSVTLRQAEAKEVTLLRSQIETLRSNGVSLMPEGLEKNISHQQMADLISFIKNWRYLDGQTPLSPGSELED
ncbi:MAG: PVC-type heme-binding CxxCH protein [Pirellulaceae bacterium]